ncbi:class A beta-lactamase-related serine hydrolase [Pseudoxanthomonas composti]|uniref:Class A beta-lactamase-related serine hydrolase n=1 Tax=Pseudoxanthomonas composti TaxID=2137479 RepID=A0A4Q1JZM2_9GAMM|nr:class A beta-lactamase-related serine hydrolase [Pseudoxanthomonas composti]
MPSPPRLSTPQLPPLLRWCTLLCLCLAALPAAALDTSALQAQLETLRAAAHAPGASAAIMVKGELVYSAGVGLADVENQVPMTGASVHNIGSVSKVLAVVGLMQLVEQDKLKLDAQIQAYAPWFPRKQAPITVRQILTHTSGIRHYKDGEFGEGDVLMYRQWNDIQAASQRWKDDPLLFDPGRYWNYSSYATNLLQAAMEQASGRPLEDYLRAQVWQPAGMTSTQFDIPARIVPRRAHAYEYDKATGALTNTPQENVSYKFVGGGVIASDEDMVRFGHALNAGKLLGKRAIAEMYRPQLKPDIEAFPNPDGSPARKPPVQALIWRVQTDGAGRRYMAHSGSVKGTYSYLANYDQQDVVVALHVNAQGGEPDLKGTAEALAASVLAGL